MMSEEAGKEHQTFLHECEEINKRSVGKDIIKFCGNEGTENDANKTTLRRLFQAVISHVENERSHIWRDAEVTMYDDIFDVYIIRAGDGHHAFVTLFDEKDLLTVIKTKKSRVHGTENERTCLLM